MLFKRFYEFFFKEVKNEEEKFWVDDFFEKNGIPEFSKETNVFYSDLINMVLVYLDKRTSFLLESADYPTPHQWKKIYFPKIKHFGKKLNLIITKDPLALKKFPRYFISKKEIIPPKTHQDIGRLLDFTWVGDFGNWRLPRHSFHVYTKWKGHNISLFSQVVIDTNIAHHKQKIKTMVKNWQNAWNNHTTKFPLQFYMKIYYDEGTLKREKKLRRNDRNYVKKHKQDYENDYWNFSNKPSESFSFSKKEKWLKMYEKENNS
jgi:hypothetical protein